MTKSTQGIIGKKYSRAILFGALAIILLVTVYFIWLSPKAEQAITEVHTTRVRLGDIMVTASGAGAVLPGAEVDLGFRSGGTLHELNVAVGDLVKLGDVLARLEENIQAESDYFALFSPAGISEMELAVVNAETNLANAESIVRNLIGPDAWYWEVQMGLPDITEAEMELASTKLDYYIGISGVNESELIRARAGLETARTGLQDARIALEIVISGPEALGEPIAALGPNLAKLEQTRRDFANTHLVAPFDGLVTSINSSVGEAVGTSPVVSMAATNELLVRFYMDETDVDKISVANRVIFTLDAYPDLPIEGTVVRIEPVLKVVDGTPVVVVWGVLPAVDAQVVMPGMTVDVEVIAGEARNALIVPVLALRELSPGSYAVFVVGVDNQLILTPVKVGLQDYANAEILSGLNAGDMISTGTVDTE